jgi:cytochrome c-type biogenesis protein CcmH
MTPFVLAAAAILIVALLLLLRPWLGKKSAVAGTGSDSLPALNAAIHRDRLAELERDRTNGVISEVDFNEAVEELQRQLLDDTAAAESSVAGIIPAGRGTLITLALLLPAAGIALYMFLGTPSATLSAEEQSKQATATMEKLVAELAQKMEKDPGNAEGWAMLARSYKIMGRWQDAEKAFDRIGPALEKDSSLLTDLAEVIAQQARSLEGRPRQLLKQALKLDPDNSQALLLAGTDSFESKRYAEAATLWGRLLKQLEPGSEDARMIESSIAKANELGGVKAAKPKVGAGETAGAAKKSAAAGAKSVSGLVDLAPAMRAKVKPSDVVFVFARAANADGSPAPRMPLAAQRARVSDLPMRFMLDDSQALNADMTISSVPTLRIEARVSRSGNATPAKGDLTGKSTIVKPGAADVTVMIDSVTE